MNYSGMTAFLSEDNIKKHFSFFNNAKLKYSILQKSVPGLCCTSPKELLSIKLRHDVKEEALMLLINIKSHETYFSSFCVENKRCDYIRKYFGSEEKFLYSLYEAGRGDDSGFLCVYIDIHGVPRFEFCRDFLRVYTKFQPILSIDLYEHAYFLDYGFKRNDYLRYALSHINLSKLEESIDKNRVK